MIRYFPRHTREVEALEPPGFKRLTLSLVEMALITGVVLRLLRAVTATHGPTQNWLYLTGVLMLGALILFGMLSLHLANFTLRKWLWRTPLFGLCEAAAEMAVSAALIFAGREPLGTGRAYMSQWWTLAGQTIGSRVVAVCVFGAVLAGVVYIARRIVIARESDARVAESLRAELFSESPEADIDPRHTA